MDAPLALQRHQLARPRLLSGLLPLSRAVPQALLPIHQRQPSSPLSRARVLVSLDRWLPQLRKFSLPVNPSPILHGSLWADLGNSGVAVGSSIGHAIGGMFGGSSSQPAEQQQADNSVAAQDGQYASTAGGYGARSCDTDATAFTKCMDEYKGNMQICGWYLEQLVSRHSFSLYMLEPEADTLSESMPAGR